MTADLRHTQGGLVTDVAAHVLTEDNEVIQGLYAAGGVTEGFSTRAGADYMSGNGLLQALVFGKIAGERAATETRGSQGVCALYRHRPGQLQGLILTGRGREDNSSRPLSVIGGLF